MNSPEQPTYSISIGHAMLRQCRKPTGWIGRLQLWRMNRSHHKLTDWALTHVSVQPRHTILDIGCGGGRTVAKLAASATEGKTYGVDYSDQNESGIDIRRPCRNRACVSFDLTVP